MKKKQLINLSRRERQIMDIIYQNGSATVSDVQANMSDPPSYSSVRALLRILEDKGFLKHEEKGRSYLYKPVITRDKAKNKALKHLMNTFFEDSAASVVAALINLEGSKLSEDDLNRLKDMIEKTRKEGR